MENEVMLGLIELMPHRFRCKVQHLIIKLTSEALDAGVIKSEEINKFGFIMSDDFNEPMKEFHEYSYNMDIEFINKIEKLSLKKQLELEQITDKMLSE